MNKVDESTQAVLRRRYKGMREEGYNEEWCRVLNRAANEIDARIAERAEMMKALDAAEQCIGELSPTSARIEVMRMLQAAMGKI